MTCVLFACTTSCTLIFSTPCSSRHVAHHSHYQASTCDAGCRCFWPCRYIYTRLAGLTRHLYNKADDKLLNYLNEEGQSIEPEWCAVLQPITWHSFYCGLQAVCLLLHASVKRLAERSYVAAAGRGVAVTGKQLQAADESCHVLHAQPGTCPSCPWCWSMELRALAQGGPPSSQTTPLGRLLPTSSVCWMARR